VKLTRKRKALRRNDDQGAPGRAGVMNRGASPWQLGEKGASGRKSEKVCEENEVVVGGNGTPGERGRMSKKYKGGLSKEPVQTLERTCTTREKNRKGVYSPSEIFMEEKTTWGALRLV